MATVFPTYPASTIAQAEDLIIFTGNQLGDIVNGDSLSEVETVDGFIPTIRKTLVDNFGFKSPIDWDVGSDETVYNQLRKFTDGSWWWAPLATVSNPIAMTADPYTNTDWKVFSKEQLTVFENTKRLAAEAGYNLVGTFFFGCTITTTTDVVLNERDGKYYSWGGTIPKVVAAGSSPVPENPTNWINRSGNTLRSELVGGGSLGLPYHVVNVDLPPYNGDLGAALDAVPAGTTLLLGNRDYDITGKYSFTSFIEKQIKIFGSGMPTLAADKSRFVSGTGTVIQGTLISVVSGFQCWDVGIDCGPYVVDTLNGGEYMEGFVAAGVITNLPFDYATYSHNVHFGNIKVLMKNATSDPATMKHGCLIEHTYGGSHGYIEVIGGYHGFVYKSWGMQPNGAVVAYGQQGEAAIFKSDGNSICGGYRNGNLILGKEGFTTYRGIIFQSGAYFGGISFDLTMTNIQEKGTVSIQGGAGQTCEDVHVTSLKIDGAVVGFEIPGFAYRWRIGEHTITNVQYGIGVNAGARGTQIADGSVVNVTYTGYTFNEQVTHGELTCDTCGVYDVVTSVPVDKSRLSRKSGVSLTPALVNDTFNYKSQLTMQAGWSNANMSAYLIPANRGELGGYVSGGNSDQIAKINSTAQMPKRMMVFPVVVESGTGIVSTLPGVITTSGDISVTGGGAIGAGGGKIYMDPFRWNFY